MREMKHAKISINSGYTLTGEKIYIGNGYLSESEGGVIACSNSETEVIENINILCVLHVSGKIHNTSGKQKKLLDHKHTIDGVNLSEDIILHYN
jgi:hypothetical protein